jgi:hypothetical protein
MSKLSVANKIFLEAVLGMDNGYVLDFTNTSFALLFSDLNIDIYDEKYAEYGVSKANRLRAFCKNGSDSEVSSALFALAEYIEGRDHASTSALRQSGNQRKTSREGPKKVPFLLSKDAPASRGDEQSLVVPVQRVRWGATKEVDKYGTNQFECRRCGPRRACERDSHVYPVCGNGDNARYHPVSEPHRASTGDDDDLV